MYPGVEVNTDDEPVLFKAQIFALTGVQPERQKVVCKGVTLRDDTWDKFTLANVSDAFIFPISIIKIHVLWPPRSVTYGNLKV